MPQLRYLAKVSIIAATLFYGPILVSPLLSQNSALANLISNAYADEKMIPQINVAGEASAAVAPDIAILQLGVLRDGITAREALDLNNAAMAEVISAMKIFGIEARDLQTSNFTIQPKYTYDNPKPGEEQKPPQIVGYTVSNDLTVRIRNLESIGDVLDKSVSLGVNSGGSITFGNDDPSKIIEAARTDAMRDAIKRATTLAEAAGVKLGRILSINENVSTPFPQPMSQGNFMNKAMVREAVPVEAGENRYSVTVSASWEIVQ